MEIRNRQQNLGFGTLSIRLPQRSRSVDQYNKLESFVTRAIETRGAISDIVEIEGKGAVLRADFPYSTDEKSLIPRLRNAGAKVIRSITCSTADKAFASMENRLAKS